MLQHPARPGRRRGVAVQNHRAAAREADGFDGHGRQGCQQGADHLPHGCEKVKINLLSSASLLFDLLIEALYSSVILTSACWKTTSRRPF